MSEMSWVMNRMEKPSSLLKFFDLVHDFLLNDHVQGSGGFVHDEERGFERQRYRDHCPLAHSAGELVRVGLEAVGADVDKFQQLRGAFAGGLLGHLFVRGEDIDDLISDGHDGVQGVHRALEDHGDVAPAGTSQFFLAQVQEIPSGELDGAACDFCRGLQEPHDRVCDGRLAAA